MIENETLGLRPYTHFDDEDMYACWQDINTQKRYNGVFNQSFDEFVKFDISRFKFWVTVVHKRTGESIGSLRFEHFDYQELSAGCYYDNTYSLKMLNKIGFIRYPEGDEKEVNCFTGKETVQFEFRIDKSLFERKYVDRRGGIHAARQFASAIAACTHEKHAGGMYPAPTTSKQSPFPLLK